MDLNKEIKLGDLFRRRAKTPGDEVAAAPEQEKPKKERRALFSRPPREKREKAPKQPKAEKKPKAPVLISWMPSSACSGFTLRIAV